MPTLKTPPPPATPEETALMLTSDMIRAAILCEQHHPGSPCDCCRAWWQEIDRRMPRKLHADHIVPTIQPLKKD